MRQYRYRITAFFVLVCMLFVALLAAPHTSALDVASENTVSCGDPDQTSSAQLKAPPDSYDIYVRLGSKAAAAQSQLYIQNTATQACQSIGSGVVQNNRWVKLGSYQVTTNNRNSLSFQLVSSAGVPLQSFNQPTILLVSQTKPACLPAAECEVQVGDMRGIVRAGNAGSSTDTLFVTRAVNVADDRLQKVEYYINDRLAYTKPQVQPFDTHYLGAGKYTTSIVAHYASGQRVIITNDVNREGLVSDFSPYIFSLVYGQKSLLQYAAVIAVVLLVISLIIEIIRKIHRRRRWMKDHFAGITDTPTIGQRLNSRLHPLVQKGGQQAGRLGKFLIEALPIIAIALIVLSLGERYVVQVNQVDGPSMDSTFASGNQLIVNQLGQTWATLSRKGYTPRRGEVVVFRRTLDISNPSLEGGSELVVKRVIGLPGDRVVVKGAKVTLYNNLHPTGFEPDSTGSWRKTMHTEDLLGTQIDVVLQPGEVFVCGDNRPNSIDSRSFGPVQTKDIIGNVILH